MRLERPTRSSDTARNYAFEDDMVRILWAVTNDRAYFTLTNKTRFGLRILWDAAAFALPNGQSSPVMHIGTRYSACTETKVPTVVVPGSAVDDVVIPCDNVSNANSTSWYVKRIFPHTWENGRAMDLSTEARFTPAAQFLFKRDRGKELRILLPLSIENVTNEYIFRFTVDSVYATRR